MLHTRRQVQPSSTAASGATTVHHFSVVGARRTPAPTTLLSSSPSKVHRHLPQSPEIDTFSTTGSAVYLFGDKKNDHRGYTVTFDSKTYHYNGTSGCGGVFGLTCEEQRPCIKFMASNLAEGNHTLKLANNANGPSQTGASFFGAHNFLVFFPTIYLVFSDFDSIVVTEPSMYGPRELSNATNPFISAPNSTNITGGTTGGTSHSAAPNGLPMMSNSLLLLFVTVILLLRPFAGKNDV
jgi:hypothetical protein